MCEEDPSKTIDVILEVVSNKEASLASAAQWPHQVNRITWQKGGKAVQATATGAKEVEERKPLKNENVVVRVTISLEIVSANVCRQQT